MKAKKYKISVCDSILDMTHGFARTIDEISVGDIFINEEGVWEMYEGRDKGMTDVKEIEFDDILYDSFKKFIMHRKSVNEDVKKLFGNIDKKLPHTERRRKK